MHRIRNGHPGGTAQVSGAILNCVWGVGRQLMPSWKPSACRLPGAAMREFRADKGIGERGLKPGSPMVFSLVRKALSSQEEPLHDGPS